MMWKSLLVSILIFAVQGQLCLSRQPGCPEPEDVYPCMCYAHKMHGKPLSILKCEHLSSDEDLKNILESSKNYIFERVSIRNSKLQYLPHNLFEDLEVHQLILEYLNLTKVFDRPPNALGKLDNLVVLSVRVESGSVWEILQPLKSLRSLYVMQMPMKKVGMDFSQNVTKDLLTLHFIDTDTKTIQPGTFDKLTKLQELRFINGSIKRLDREMFPTPFHADYLSFDYQKIMEIQEGLFTHMPNLRHLTLQNNQIATIPEKAFDSDFKFYNLLLDDNPIKCDCRFKWIVFKDVQVRGNCASPKWLRGKQLNHLSKAYFYNCKDTSP